MQKQRGSMMIPLLLILVVVILAGAGFYFFKTTNNPSQTNSPVVQSPQSTSQPTVKPTSTATVSASPQVLDDNYALYTNKTAGFSIKYPKVADAGTLKIFEDLTENSVYLSVTEFSYPPSTSGGKVLTKQTDLNILKNGVDVGMPNSQSYPTNYHFYYNTISSDTELLSLANKAYGPGCKGVHKTQVAGSENFSVKIDGFDPDKDVEDADGNRPCWLNFSYKYLYSPSNKLAVLWGEGQDVAWGIKGKVLPVTVDFLNK